MSNIELALSMLALLLVLIPLVLCLNYIPAPRIPEAPAVQAG